MEKLSVLLRGPLITKSGYGVHSRQIARFLFDHAQELNLDISTELLPWGQTPWFVNTNAENGLIRDCVQASTNQKQFYDITIACQLPNEWNPMLGKYNIGVTAGVETDQCNPQWIDCINRMNLVIVPSQFVKVMFETTAKLHNKEIITKLLVVPESFPDEMLAQNLSAKNDLDLQLETDFNFLLFGQITGNNPENDRKNLFYTVKWFSELFIGNPNVGLIVKTNVGRYTKLDQLIVINLFQKLLAELKVNNKNGPKFYLLHGDMNNEEVRNLYTHPKVKALLSFHRGEGFGLSLLEAAACGLPVIATGWSAPTEFLGLGKYIKVDHTLTKIHESRVDNNIFVPNAQWANPLEHDAKQRILKFYNSPEKPTQWAKELSQQKIQNLYSFQSISNQYKNILLEVLKEC